MDPEEGGDGCGDRSGGSDAAGLSFLHRRLSATFDRKVVTVEPGGRRPYVAAEWRDALVVLERGEVLLECADGGRRRFAAGAVLWLAGLGLIALHNEGVEPAVLVAVSRRAPPTGDLDLDPGDEVAQG